MLIDGQQRFTTLTLLLIALRDHIRETEWSSSNNGASDRKIDEFFIVNSLETGEKHYKLILRRKDNQTLRALIEGTTANELVNERSKLIDEAYSYFRKELEVPTVNPESVYPSYLTNHNI